MLIYAPLHNMAALVNEAAARHLQDDLRGDNPRPLGKLKEIASYLHVPDIDMPTPPTGDFVPSMLGILPTRACNMQCGYCDFIPENGGKTMPLQMAKDAVNWYMRHIQDSGADHAMIHFFGGEPFCGEAVIEAVVNTANEWRDKLGCTIHFEAATNGTFSPERCEWVATHFNSIVLSLDGPADIQNLHRPRRGGKGSFDIVVRNARRLAKGPVSLALRSCITADTVDRMVEIAIWFAENIRPAAVCFEPLQPNPWSEQAGMYPPDPYQFARNFIQVTQILAAYNISTVYATTDIRNRWVSFCPVATDAVIVSPDGALSACYLLQKDWEAKGFDLQLGQINTAQHNQVEINQHQAERIRRINVLNKARCEGCFCRWHCAGGCHVNHNMNGADGDYDRLCTQTRLITLYNILATIGDEALIKAWLHTKESFERPLRQPNDSLLNWQVLT